MWWNKPGAGLPDAGDLPPDRGWLFTRLSFVHLEVDVNLTAEQIAHVVHEAQRALQRITGDPAVSPTWYEAPASQRDSCINGVRLALGGATPEELHAEWVRWRRDHGWRYGAVKDEWGKTHPSLVAYEQLPEDQRVKDQLFLAIVRVFASAAAAVESV
jgi:hypothetical protein